MILEVLHILEGEINLREETRVAQQARQGVTSKEHQTEATRLSDVQDALRERVDKSDYSYRRATRWCTDVLRMTSLC